MTEYKLLLDDNIDLSFFVIALQDYAFKDLKMADEKGTCKFQARALKTKEGKLTGLTIIREEINSIKE